MWLTPVQLRDVERAADWATCPEGQKVVAAHAKAQFARVPRFSRVRGSVARARA